MWGKGPPELWPLCRAPALTDHGPPAGQEWLRARRLAVGRKGRVLCRCWTGTGMKAGASSRARTQPAEPQAWH